MKRSKSQRASALAPWVVVAVILAAPPGCGDAPEVPETPLDALVAPADATAAQDAEAEAGALDLAACLALEPGRRWELAVPDRPTKRRTLEVAEVPLPSAGGAVARLDEVGAQLVRLSVIKDDERKDVLFATRGSEAWLVGLDVDATPAPLWFEPFVPIYGPGIAPDDEPRTTDVVTSGRVSIDAGLFDTEVDVDASGSVTITWTPNERADRVTLTLAVALEAEASIAGLPVTHALDERLQGLLDESTGWVELIDSKRTYVVVEPER